MELDELMHSVTCGKRSQPDGLVTYPGAWGQGELGIGQGLERPKGKNACFGHGGDGKSRLGANKPVP